MTSIAFVVKGAVSMTVGAALLAGCIGVAAADGLGEFTVSGDVLTRRPSL
jgi:hypothetical protein